MKTIYALATPNELAAELGKFITLKRVARRWLPADLADASSLTLDEVVQIEAGQGGNLLAFMRIAQALNFAHDFMALCEPRPTTLDELERIEIQRAKMEPASPIRPT